MDPEKTRFAWWFYFWFLVALATISPFFGPLDPVGWAQWSFELVGIAGLWGYLRRKPIVHLQLWRAYFLAVIVSLLYGGFSAIFGDPPDPFSGVAWHGFLAVVTLFVWVITVPLLVGLWRYAFRSPSIWQSTGSAA